MHGQALHLHLQVKGQYKDRHCASIPWQYGEAEIGLPIACPVGSDQVLNSLEGVFLSLSRTFPQSDYADGSGDQHGT